MTWNDRPHRDQMLLPIEFVRGVFNECRTVFLLSDVG